MSFDINGKTVLVTGANRGIGKVIVEQFAKAGAGKIYATARKPESIQPLIDALGDKVVAMELDLAKPETIQAAAQNASDVHVVINNGGILLGDDALSNSAFETLEKELTVNLHGLMHMAMAFAPVLKANGGGVFAQLNSVASLRNFAPAATYSVSKAAAYSYTQMLHDRLAEQGTQVISVHPGPIATDMAASGGFLDIADPPEWVADAILDAMKTGDFHVFPDTMAKQFWEAYEPFGKNIVEPPLSKG